MTRILVYVGINQYHPGDEGMYLALKKLFSEYELIPHGDLYQPVSDDITADVTLFGGGDVIPNWLMASKIRRSKLNYCLGVGVLDPDFFHRPFDEIEPENMSQNILKKTVELVNRSHLLAKIIRRAWPNRLGDPLNLAPYLNTDEMSKRDFQKVAEFGFDRIGVRGSVSQEILRKHGIASTVVADTALYCEPTAYHYERNYKIGINIIAPGTQQKWTQDDTYIKHIISFCNSISDKYRFVILTFFPRDLEVNQELSREIKNATLLNFSARADPDAQGVLDEISTCDLMIAERFHATSFGACCHVPFISLEYQPKKLDLTKSLDLEDLSIRIDQVTYEKLEELFNKTVGNPDLIDRIRRNVANARKKLEDFTDLIKTDIEHRLPM